jgi:hypothetical protein
VVPSIKSGRERTELKRVTLRMLLIASVASGACRIGELPFNEQYDRFRSIRPRMTEMQVREKLGEPAYTYTKGTSPDEYCVRGWACERREIRHRLLIYKAGEPIAYVYLDSSDRVEHVFVGGS